MKYKPFASFELPASNLPEAQVPLFHAGKALANQPWIKAPTATDARDGLGPIYNARTCLGCHIKGGKGPVPATNDEAIFAPILRISIPGKNVRLGSVPDPIYGEQIQGQSVALTHQLRGKIPYKVPSENPEAPPEARVYINWKAHTFTYPDGHSVTLRSPKVRLDEMGYGAASTTLMTSLRAAPAIHGMGLLEAIEQADINALADPEDADGDGISGRVNTVWDFENNAPVPGRFGWKANRANLRITTAAAFQGDVGISNPIFPNQPCSRRQPRCLASPNGNNTNGFELPEHLLKLTVDFVRNIGVPMARPMDEKTKRGHKYFHQVGCAACHQPSFKTGPQPTAYKHLAAQDIWPYSDLLLHDMGSGLADHRPDYDATGYEWRTAPLWGIGLNRHVNGVTTLLHDGRARSIEEAILWHGGESENSRAAFTLLDEKQRNALITFVESL